MKRLRKITHVVLVWISICLLLVDPAAACRFLANRRCCCPCPAPSCCATAAPAPLKALETLPSDAPPGATMDAGQLQAAPLAAPSPSVGPTHPVATESLGSKGAANPDSADAAEPTTATIAPAKPLEIVSDAPSVAP